MNILMVGHGNGSWAVRGVQLGAALGARRREQPADADLRWADIVVLIKRADPIWSSQARALGKPVVWDALDFWQQPEQNSVSEAEAMRLLHAQMAILKPHVVIGATEGMAAAAGGVYLPHHVRPGLTAAPVRAQVRTVAYEGVRKFLGRWAAILQQACEQRGWRFVINPPDLRMADLIVAFRDGRHDGWLCREWKSGIKIINAMAVGRPMVTQDSAAIRELRPVGSVVETVAGLTAAFDRWTDAGARAHARDQPVGLYHLDQVAARYRLILQHATTRSVAA